MDASHTAECTACDGTGEQFEDVCTSRGEHDTRAVTCTECGGSGEADFADAEPTSDDLNAEVTWEVAL